MNVLDSSGWIEYFIRGKHYDTFAPCVEDFSNLLVPTIILVEVLKYIDRFRDEEDVVAALEVMRLAQIVPLNEEIALQAVSNNRQYKLPLADSIIHATAKIYNATLWTLDAHFEGIEGVQYFAK